MKTLFIRKIYKIIGTQFDSLSLKFLGIIPSVTKDKRIVFSTVPRKSIISLFLESLENKTPNKEETDAIKTMVSIASGYIEGLKHRTIAKVINDIDSHIKDQKANDKNPSSAEIKKIVSVNMDKAKNHFKLIANAESNRVVNVGTALQISKIAEEKGVKDPVTFFVVTIDDVTGKEEFVLHLLPDRKTPRVWRLSEIKSGYHKVGDAEPKFGGLHVNCRCKITYLAEDWGFDEDGKVTYKGPGWDEFENQRKKYGLPR